MKNTVLNFFKNLFKGRLDMNKNNAYIYYSGATDVTGKKLVDGLGIKGTNKKPTAASVQMVIGWGAKTKDDVTFPKKVEVLNHPNAIRQNRNKFAALNVMAADLNTAAKTHIAVPITTDNIKAAIGNNEINYPMIGRKKYHQGGKGFWECPTVAQLDAAITAGAHHFQQIIAVQDEYRLHVFKGEVIHAVKKVQRTEKEFEVAWIEDELNRQKDYWAKNNQGAFNEEQAKIMLARQSKDAAKGGPNMLLRSNKMGWKFSIVKKYPADMVKVAVKAVKALGLDFGAVDCCVDVNANPWIFEVNTGPGLEGTSLKLYLAAFEKAIGGKTDKKVAKPAKTAAIDPNAPAGKPVAGDEKVFLKMQLSRLSEMIDDVEDPTELAALKKLGTKLIFGNQD